MPEIKIKIRDKRAGGTGTVICGNSDYTVAWDLDQEWTPYDTKTMRVNLADGTYQDVVFAGDTAALPALSTPGWASVGLYAGDLHTSRAADLRVLPSVTTPSGAPANPTPDVYDQLMELIKGLGGAQGEKGDTGPAGPQGPAGATGPQGPAGHSPVVTATKSGKVTTIEVDGTAIAAVNDGADAEDMDCTIPRFTVSCNRCTVSCGLLWFGYISSDSVKCKGSSCVQNIELCRPKLPETKKALCRVQYAAQGYPIF